MSYAEERYCKNQVKRQLQQGVVEWYYRMKWTHMQPFSSSSLYNAGDFPTASKMAGVAYAYSSKLSSAAARSLVRITKGLRYTWLRSASSGAGSTGTGRDGGSRRERYENTTRLLYSAGALGAWGLCTAAKQWREKVTQDDSLLESCTNSSSAATPSSSGVHVILCAVNATLSAALPRLSASEGPNSKRFNFLAETVDKAAPSVVFVERKHVVASFLGAQAMAVSSGSGFVVDKDGYVLTNAHVVGNSACVKVRLPTGKERTGHVVEVDQVADLALVKLEMQRGEKLPSLKFGSSSNVRPGEWVVAMGSPLALSNTITAGIISCVHREGRELGLEKGDMGYLQTDASITIGNSGGPLVNLDGEVVGVNTMTAAPGISFAIPGDIAKKFVAMANKSIATSHIKERFGIGVAMISITPSILSSLLQRIILPEDFEGGVFLAQVTRGGRGAEGGLRRGDVITAINGRPVYSAQEVIDIVQKGKQMDMEVLRGRQKIICRVTPERMEY